MCGVIGIHRHPEAANLAYLVYRAVLWRREAHGGARAGGR